MKLGTIWYTMQHMDSLIIFPRVIIQTITIVRITVYVEERDKKLGLLLSALMSCNTTEHASRCCAGVYISYFWLQKRRRDAIVASMKSLNAPYRRVTQNKIKTVRKLENSVAIYSAAKSIGYRTFVWRGYSDV